MCVACVKYCRRHALRIVCLSQVNLNPKIKCVVFLHSQAKLRMMKPVVASTTWCFTLTPPQTPL